MSRIDEIKARMEAATEGPWEAGRGQGNRVSVLGPREAFDEGRGPARLAVMQMPYRTQPMEANAEFMANARQDIPYLLDEIERLKRGSQ